MMCIEIFLESIVTLVTSKSINPGLSFNWPSYENCLILIRGVYNDGY